MPLSPTDPRFRPLLAAVPRVTESGVEMDVGERAVGVEGEPLEVARLLSLCDGSRTAEQVASQGGIEAAEVSELLVKLHGAGAVVDCGEAWRLFQAASAPTSRLLRAPTEEDVAEAGGGRFEPAGSGGALPLRPTATEIDGALARRRSSGPHDPPRPVAFEELSAVLSRSYGGRPPAGRAVPSGGALYPLVLHVALGDELGGAGPGTWWYDPSAEALVPIRSGSEWRTRILVPAEDTAAHLAHGQPIVVISAEISRAARKYGARAYRLALLEAGAAMQNAYLASASLGVPVRAMLGIDEGAAAEALELPDGTVPLLALFVGI